MIEELSKLRQLTDTLIGNGYLRDQAEEWEYALDAIPEPTFIINKKFKLRFANIVLLNILGVTIEEIYGKTFHTIMTDDSDDCSNTPSYWSDQDQLLACPLIKDVYLKRLDGWFDISRSPIYTRAGRLLGFICVLQNITKQKKAIELSMLKESLLSTVFDSAPIGIGIIRKDRVILSVNTFMKNLLGYCDSDLVGSSARIFYPTEEEFDRVGRIKMAEIERIGVGELDTQFKTKSGKILDIHLKTTKINDGSKLVFTVSDITDRKRKEKQLKLRESNLKSSKDKFKSVFINSKDAIIIVKLDDSTIVDVNPACENYTGYTKNEMVGKTTVDLNLWEDLKDRDKFLSIISKSKWPVDGMNAGFRTKAGVIKKGSISSSIVTIDDVIHTVSVIKIV